MGITIEKSFGPKNLQDLLDLNQDIVEYFRNYTLAPHAKHRHELTPVPREFTNWRDEQRAWRETAVLFDQSYHMPELYLRGPGARDLLKRLSPINLDNLAPGRAKQYFACSPEGYFIGECVLHQHGPDDFQLISGMHLLNWVHFNADLMGDAVKVERDNAIWDNPLGQRNNFRFGLDGPNAGAIFAAIVEGDAPEIPFFRTARVKIAGHDVLALRHGMAGHKGVELSGSFDGRDAVLAALLQAGSAYGLKRGGTLAYFSTLGESGWLPYPLPAIYTSPSMRAFREWLPATSWEANSQIGGSFVSGQIDDYYVTPWHLGLERLIDFDHDFVGREALKEMALAPQRTKVTLVLAKDDVAKINGSMYEADTPFKAFDLPASQYSFQQADQVLDTSGRLIGLSTFCGYSVNERAMLALAMIDVADAVIGNEVAIVWGEPDGGTLKPHVERHVQTTIRATIAGVPYAQAVQKMKRSAMESSANAASHGGKAAL